MAMEKHPIPMSPFNPTGKGQRVPSPRSIPPISYNGGIKRIRTLGPAPVEWCLSSSVEDLNKIKAEIKDIDNKISSIIYRAKRANILVWRTSRNSSPFEAQSVVHQLFMFRSLLTQLYATRDEMEIMAHYTQIFIQRETMPGPAYDPLTDDEAAELLRQLSGESAWKNSEDDASGQHLTVLSLVSPFNPTGNGQRVPSLHSIPRISSSVENLADIKCDIQDIEKQITSLQLWVQKLVVVADRFARSRNMLETQEVVTHLADSNRELAELHARRDELEIIAKYTEIFVQRENNPVLSYDFAAEDEAEEQLRQLDAAAKGEGAGKNSEDPNGFGMNSLEQRLSTAANTLANIC